MFGFSALTTLILGCLCLPAQDLDDIEKTLARAVDKSTYEAGAYAAAKKLAKIRTTDAMELRLDLFDSKLSTYRGVYLRDWFYSGFQRSETLAEATLLVRAAQDKKRSDWQRELALRSLLSNKAMVPAKEILHKSFLKTKGSLRFTWQMVVGTLLAEDRLDTTSFKGKDAQAEARAMLLKAGAPFAGHLKLPSLTSEEIKLIKSALLKSKDEGTQAICLRVLARHPESRREFLAAAGPALLNSAIGPRVAVVEEAVQQRIGEAIPLLIHALRQDIQDGGGRFISDFSNALRSISGMSFGNTPDLWQRWWTNEGDTFLQDLKSGKLTSTATQHEESGTTAQLFGIPIESQKIAILVDGSGSMVTSKLGDQTCAEAAASELEIFLANLPEGALANLVLVAREPIFALKKMTPLSKKTRKTILDTVTDFDYRSTSSLWDALQLVQNDPSVDTIVLIGDGGSSSGKHQYPGHIREANRLERMRTGVRIHCVCVSERNSAKSFMEQLASESGGRLVVPSR